MKCEQKPHVVLLGTSLKCQHKICYSFGPFPRYMKVMTRASSLAHIPNWWWLVEPLCWTTVMSCMWDNLFLCFKPLRYLSWGVCVHVCVCVCVCACACTKTYKFQTGRHDHTHWEVWNVSLFLPITKSNYYCFNLQLK